MIDSGPFRYVSAFMNSKPYVKYISLSGMSMIAALKLTKNKSAYPSLVEVPVLMPN